MRMFRNIVIVIVMLCGLTAFAIQRPWERGKERIYFEDAASELIFCTNDDIDECWLVNLRDEHGSEDYYADYDKYEYSVYHGNIVVPDSAVYNDNKYAVVGIRNCFNGMYDFSKDLGWKDSCSVTLPKTLKYLDRCFYQNEVIREIELPEGLLEINDSFFYADSLKQINFPSTLLSIERSFLNVKLENLSLPESLIRLDGFYVDANVKELILGQNLKYLVGFKRLFNNKCEL